MSVSVSSAAKCRDVRIAAARHSETVLHSLGFSARRRHMRSSTGAGFPANHHCTICHLITPPVSKLGAVGCLRSKEAERTYLEICDYKDHLQDMM